MCSHRHHIIVVVVVITIIATDDEGDSVIITCAILRFVTFVPRMIQKRANASNGVRCAVCCMNVCGVCCVVYQASYRTSRDNAAPSPSPSSSSSSLSPTQTQSRRRGASAHCKSPLGVELPASQPASLPACLLTCAELQSHRALAAIPNRARACAAAWNYYYIALSSAEHHTHYTTSPHKCILILHIVDESIRT